MAEDLRQKWEEENDLLCAEIDKDDLHCGCCRPWDKNIYPPEGLPEGDWRWRCSKRRPYHIATDKGVYPRAQQLNRRCNKIQHSKLFGGTSLAAILGVTVLIGIQSYDYTSDTMSFFENSILGIFVLEIVVKMWARGLLFYFCIYWNIFDFVIVLLTSEMLPIGGDSMAVLRLLRLLRMMKLAKVGPLQAILTGLQKGFRSLVYVMLLLFMVYYVYAIIGITLFATNDPMHFESLHESMLTLFRVSTLEDWTDIMYLNMYGCGNTAYEYPVQRERPLNVTVAKAGYGYHGTYPCVEPEKWPLLSPIFFCTFVVISALVMLSLFIGLISAEIEAERERQDDEERKNRSENREKDTDPMVVNLGRLFAHLGAVKMWFDEPAVRESRSMMHASAPDSGYLRSCRRVEKFCASGPWQTLILTTIFGAAICAGLETEYSDDGLNPNKDIQDTTKVLEVIILCVFTVEAVLLIYAEGSKPWNYFRDKMNCFDFFIVVICFVVVIASSVFNSEVQALRMMRLLRLLKLLNAFPELRNIINGLIGGLTSIGFITGILVLVFYVYAIIGLLLFRENDPYHFKNLHVAMLTLFRVATFEDWTDVMYINYLGCDRWGYSEGADEDGRGGSLPDHDIYGVVVNCDNPQANLFGSVTYFITFVIIAAFIMLSLFIGVITSSMLEAKSKAQVVHFTEELLGKLEKKFPPWLSEKVVDPTAKSTSSKKELFRRAFLRIDTDRGGYLVLEEINSYLYQMYSHAITLQKYRKTHEGGEIRRWTKKQREDLLNSIMVPRDNHFIKEHLNFAQFLRLMRASELDMTPARLQHDMVITKGRICVRMQWTPRRPPQAKLVATIIEAKGLKNMDLSCFCLGTQNDVYAKVSISKSGGGTVSKTCATVKNGGATPKWVGNTLNIPHKLVFEADRLPERAFLRLFDEDENSADDLIGMAVIPLDKPTDFGVGLSETDPWETEQWYTLLNTGGEKTGECLMKLAFTPASQNVESGGGSPKRLLDTSTHPRPSGRFRFTVVKGSALENMVSDDLAGQCFAAARVYNAYFLVRRMVWGLKHWNILGHLGVCWLGQTTCTQL